MHIAEGVESAALVVTQAAAEAREEERNCALALSSRGTISATKQGDPTDRKQKQKVIAGCQ